MSAAKYNRISLWVLIFLNALFAFVIFTADLLLPLGIAVGGMYCIVILYTWLIRIKHFSALTGIVCSVLILVGYIYSEDLATENQFPEINRIISIISVWICAALVMLAKKSLSELKQVQDGLEKTVYERTYQLNERMLALRDSQLKFKGLLDSAPDATLMYNLTYNVVMINKAAVDLFGYSAEELIGNQVSNLFPIEDGMGKLAIDDTIIVSKTGKSFEGRGLKKSGEIFPVEVSVSPIKLGEEMIICAAIRDVSDRKEKAKTIIENQRRLIESQRIARVGTWEVNLETNEAYWSDEMYNIFGVNRNKFELSYHAVMNIIHEEDKSTVERNYQRAIEKNEPYDLLYRLSINEEIKYVHGRGEIVVDEETGFRKMLGTLADVTAQQEIETKILEQSERLKQSQKIAHIGSFELDVINKSALWSAELYNIYGKDSAIFEPAFDSLLEMVHKKDRTKLEQLLQSAISAKEPFECSHRIITEHGENKFLECKGEVVVQNNEVIKVIGTALDITKMVQKENDLRRYSKQLEHKNTELEQFAYIASHDLQEPLHTVTSFARLLNDKYANKIDDTGKKSLNFMLEATSRMKSLIIGLLEYSRIGRELENVSIDVNKCIEGIINDLKVKIETESISIKVYPELPNIAGNETEIRLLFQNLISNAIKFKQQGSFCEIEIGVNEKGKWNEFFVKDNGIGIDKKHQEKIFEIFKRLHSQAEYEGTGIGLSHCKKIVELHGGNIWVDSKLKEGTTFFFTFPIV